MNNYLLNWFYKGEKVLRQRIGELLKYRKNGITKIEGYQKGHGIAIQLYINTFNRRSRIRCVGSRTRKTARKQGTCTCVCISLTF